MFTQKISMDCTKEQYEKYLKEELEKMGYKKGDTELWTDDEFCSIVNNWNEAMGVVGNVSVLRRIAVGRTYLGSFNAPLFLALAAMTDDFGYGEWSVLKSGVFVRRQEDGKGYCHENGGRVKACVISRDHPKASAEEIKSHFAQADKLNAEPQKPLNKGSVTFDVKLDTTGLEEQLDQFSKRFEAKIKEETLSAYLDKVIKDLEEILGTDEKHKEPIVGEMAIMWNKYKANAVCTIYGDCEDELHYTSNGVSSANAILYESPEQYKSFLKS